MKTVSSPTTKKNKLQQEKKTHNSQTLIVPVEIEFLESFEHQRKKTTLKIERERHLFQFNSNS